MGKDVGMTVAINTVENVYLDELKKGLADGSDPSRRCARA